jgi:hypothetical protein
MKNNVKADELKRFTALRASYLATALAYALKEQFMGIWDLRVRAPAPPLLHALVPLGE